MNSQAGSMEAWVALGVPKSKLNVGLAFYGRAWRLDNPLDHAVGAAAGM